MTNTETLPNISNLGRWLHSWVQADGAIHGFHNHTVWGDNPPRYGDFTCGHSAFAAPLVPALACALHQRPDPRGRELVRRLVAYQINSRQPDGQFDHVGFQCGDTSKSALIHNVVACASLCETVRILGSDFPAELRGAVDRRVREVLEANDQIHGAEANENTCANQEYCRLWARLLHMEVFVHGEWDGLVRRSLDFLLSRMRVPGLPDSESVGCLRHLSDPRCIEPAEYYGLMIFPLLLAGERYGGERYRREASAIARHVVRSAWRDAQGQQRFHRLWYRAKEEWIKSNEPMLVGGMGMTLAAIHTLNRLAPDAELAGFLARADQTYACYQSPRGFFLAATGWDDCRDLIPATAWQSHDLFHLLSRHGASEMFWEDVCRPFSDLAVVFGRNTMWLETQTHWAVRGYMTAQDREWVGRKDRAQFHLDVPRWVSESLTAPADFIIPDEPKFLHADTAFIQISGRTDIVSLNTTGLNLE